MVPLIFQREELPELDGFLCKISDSYGKNLGNDERSPKRLSGLFVNVVDRRLASSNRAGGSNTELVGQILNIAWQLSKTGRAVYSKFYKNW